MRIAYITPYYPPFVKGGMEISLKLLAEALAKLGHQILVFVPNYEKDDEVEGQNPKIFRIKFGKDTVFSRNNPIATSYFAKKITEGREKFDLIDAYKWFFPARTVSEKLKIPYICSIRDATPVCDFRVDVKPKYYPFFEYFSKRFVSYGISPRQIVNAAAGFILTSQNLRIISQASCLTFASQALAKIFKKYNQCGEVIYSVGLPNFVRGNVEIPEINFRNDKGIIYAGRLSNGKGAGFLFEAAKKVIEKERNIKFVFVGDGELMNEISNTEHQNQIICLGKNSHEFVLSLIGKSYLAVVPSLVFEGFPRIAIESVSLGTPVVGTNIGGIGEAIGEAGILVEAGNVNQLTSAILKICQDENLYYKLKSQTKIQAEKFTPEKIAQKVINLYQKILKL